MRIKVTDTTRPEYYEEYSCANIPGYKTDEQLLEHGLRVLGTTKDNLLLVNSQGEVNKVFTVKGTTKRVEIG